MSPLESLYLLFGEVEKVGITHTMLRTFLNLSSGTFLSELIQGACNRIWAGCAQVHPLYILYSGSVPTILSLTTLDPFLFVVCFWSIDNVTQGLFLPQGSFTFGRFGKPYRMPKIELGSTVCNTNALSAILSLQPLSAYL